MDVLGTLAERDHCIAEEAVTCLLGTSHRLGELREESGGFVCCAERLGEFVGALASLQRRYLDLRQEHDERMAGVVAAKEALVGDLDAELAELFWARQRGHAEALSLFGLWAFWALFCSSVFYIYARLFSSRPLISYFLLSPSFLLI